MKDEKYLVKVSQGRFSKIKRFFKRIFKRNKLKRTMQREKQYIENLKRNDLQVLKQIINGTVSIKSLDIDTKKRLIMLCDTRLKEITKKINDKNVEIRKIEKILDESNL